MRRGWIPQSWKVGEEEEEEEEEEEDNLGRREKTEVVKKGEVKPPRRIIVQGKSTFSKKTKKKQPKNKTNFFFFPNHQKVRFGNVFRHPTPDGRSSVCDSCEEGRKGKGFSLFKTRETLAQKAKIFSIVLVGCQRGRRAP